MNWLKLIHFCAQHKWVTSDKGCVAVTGPSIAHDFRMNLTKERFMSLLVLINTEIHAEAVSVSVSNSEWHCQCVTVSTEIHAETVSVSVSMSKLHCQCQCRNQHCTWHVQNMQCHYHYHCTYQYHYHCISVKILKYRKKESTASTSSAV